MIDEELRTFIDSYKDVILQRFKLYSQLDEELVPKKAHDIVEFRGELFQLTENPLYSLEGTSYKFKAMAVKVSDGSRYTLKWLSGSTGTVSTPSTIFDHPLDRVRWDRPIRVEPVTEG